MRLLARLALAVLILLPAAPRAVSQGPPRAETEPADGRLDVPAGRGRIVIRFDQEMAPSMSVSVTDWPFPKVLGQPRWRDARTLELEVELAADRRYGFGINGRGLRGFQSRSGVPAEALELSFRTAGGAILAEEAKIEALRRLHDALSTRYSYRKLHGLDESFVLDRESLLAASTARDFAERLSRELARIPDPHLWLAIGDEILPCHRRNRDAYTSARTIARRLGNWRKITNDCADAEIEGGIHYLMLTTLADEASVAGAIAAIEKARDARAFIIDLRLNGGGDETRARRLAGLFTDRERVYAKHRSVDPAAEGGFGPLVERRLLPARAGSAISAPVAVLVGPGILSSAEALVLMFRAIPTATLVGAATGGSSGNPQPHDLGIGVTLQLPSWIAYDADEKPFEGRGIEPDLAVPLDRGDFEAGRDPVLERAIALLREKLAH